MINNKSNAAYGIGKAACDRMAADCGIELKKHHVTSIGLLLGGVKTEYSKQMLDEKGDKAVLKLDPNNPFLNVKICHNLFSLDLVFKI